MRCRFNRGDGEFHFERTVRQPVGHIIFLGKPTLPDEEIVARVLQGETSLYGSLVQRHTHRLYKILWRILYNHEAVEDVMQEARARALTYLHQFEGRSSFIMWLTRVMINEAYEYLRRRRVF